MRWVLRRQSRWSASRTAGRFQRYDVPDRLDVTGALTVNPLYRMERAGDGGTRLTRQFPTPAYEDEFALATRYLPPAVTVAADLTGATRAITPDLLGADYDLLRRARIVLDAPPGLLLMARHGALRR